MHQSDVRSFISGGGVAILVVLTLSVLLTGESRAAETQGNELNRPREVWVAIRDDGKDGTGAVTDSFDGGSVEKLNALFEKFGKEYGENLTIHFGPGVYYGDRELRVLSNWKIRGAGMDITIFKTKPNPESIKTVGFGRQAVGFEISDVTIDFNILNLRKANRVFTWPRGEIWGAGENWKSHRLCYFFAKDLPDWKAGTGYKRGQAVRHKETEYMCVTKRGKDCTEEPGTGEGWNVLRSNHPEELPAWKAGQNYTIGDAVSAGGAGYVCWGANPSNPTADGAGWEAVNPEAIDPLIDPHAVYVYPAVVGGEYQSGRNRVSRVRALNGNGSEFFDREGFVIMVGGSDGVIEDCVVEQFHGDYATLIVLFQGRNSVVRGCTVKSNSGEYGYGGWGCFDVVFENNYGENLSYATNVDSLNNRNVTFRNNVFVNISFAGIQVSPGTGRYTGQYAANMFRIDLDGRKFDLNNQGIDGLYIYDNYVEMCDSLTWGAAAISARGRGEGEGGLRNVVIRGNTLRTKSGQGRRGSIMVSSQSGQNATNATVYDNICEPNMYCEIIPPAVIGVWHNNVDLLGQPMKDRQGQPISGD